MFYIAIAVFTLIVHFLLVLSTNVNIFPELYYLPWLVHKGYVPYRDFFDHHGFLLYYLLSPLTANTTLWLLKLFYYWVATANLLLQLLILRRTTNKIGYGIGAFLAVLVGFFMAENHLWYDVVITTIYLLVYLLLVSGGFRGRGYLIGTLVATATMIKPNAGIVLLPVLLYSRDSCILVSFVLAWLPALILLWFSRALQPFLTSFAYTSYLAHMYHPFEFVEPKFFLVSAILLLCAIGIMIKEKKYRPVLLTLLFFLCSFVFFGTAISRDHYPPIMTFLILLLSQAVDIKASLYRAIFTALLILYCLQTAYEVSKHPAYLNTHRIPWQEDPNVLPLIAEVGKLRTKHGLVYVYANRPQVYMAINQMPPTYYSLYFPKLEAFVPHYEERIISDLERAQVGVVAVYKPDLLDPGYKSFHELPAYIERHFHRISDTPTYQVYVR